MPRPPSSAAQRHRARPAKLALRLAGLALLPVLAGCSASHITSQLEQGGLARQRVELASVPFYPQTANHCGPAALATVLGDSGVDVSPALLADAVFVPGRQGSLQVEMLAAARRHGRIAYRLPGRLDALLRELGGGRPVLVLQDLALLGEPVWHYAVLVGFDREQRQVTLRSGTEHSKQLPMALFERSWARAGHWAAITLRPGELPAEVDRERYLRAVSPLERIGAWPAAAPAWRAALQIWPRDLTASIGLASALHGLGDTAAAIGVLRGAVHWHPHAADAHNNLAFLLGQQGDVDRALHHAGLAVQLGGARLATYRETLRELRRHADPATRPPTDAAAGSAPAAGAGTGLRR